MTEPAPFADIDPEHVAEMMRRASAAFNEMARQLVGIASALDGHWPGWREFAANVGDYVPEPPHRGCHCLCAVAHGGLGVCTGEAEDGLFLIGRLDGGRVDIQTCRACFDAKALIPA